MELFQGKPLEHLGDIPSMNAARYPNNDAVVFGDEAVTYRELEERANRVANALHARGLGPGDRVGLYVPNSATFAEVYFGVLKSGAVAVPLNVKRQLSDLEFIVEDAAITALVGAGSLTDEVLELARHAPVKTVFLPGSSDDSVIDYDEAVAESSREFERPNRAYDDVAVMLYTSGTTGKPKGVPLTHENLLTAIESGTASGYHVPVDPESSILLAIPLFHVAGLNSILGVYMYEGATVVILASSDPEDMLRAVEEHSIENIGGVPTLYTKMNEVYQQSPEEYEISSLEYVAGAGANLPEATRRALVEEWNVSMLEGWGMTETSPSGTFQPHRGVQKGAGCIGPAMYNFTLKLVDPVTRETKVPAEYLQPHVDVTETELDFDEENSVTGEIAVTGPQIFERYHNRPKLNEEVFDDGWFYTKDIARVDEDGYLWIKDRADDMILTGGENVYPARVEDALHEHPAVREAAVVPVDHETKGEAPVAFVDVGSDADVSERDLREFTLDRVPSYAHPRRIIFVDDLPKSATQKIQRFKLEEKAAERLDTPLEPSDTL